MEQTCEVSFRLSLSVIHACVLTCALTATAFDGAACRFMLEHAEHKQQLLEVADNSTRTALFICSEAQHHDKSASECCAELLKAGANALHVTRDRYGICF